MTNTKQNFMMFLLSLLVVGVLALGAIILMQRSMLNSNHAQPFATGAAEPKAAAMTENTDPAYLALLEQYRKTQLTRKIAEARDAIFAADLRASKSLIEYKKIKKQNPQLTTTLNRLSTESSISYPANAHGAIQVVKRLKSINAVHGNHKPLHEPLGIHWHQAMLHQDGHHAASPHPITPPLRTELHQQLQHAGAKQTLAKVHKNAKSSTTHKTVALVKHHTHMAHKQASIAKRHFTNKSKKQLAFPGTLRSHDANLARNISKHAKQFHYSAPEKTILALKDNAYTIRLFETTSLKKAKRFELKHKKTAKVSYYRVLANSKVNYVVVYGQYPTVRETLDAIANLPIELQRYEPSVIANWQVKAELHEFARVENARQAFA